MLVWLHQPKWSLNTNLTSLEKENNTAIAATLLKSSARRHDPTLGDALAIAGTKETITEHIQKGGIWIYPILSFALLSFIVAAWKASQIRKIKSPDPDALNQVLALLREDKDSEAFKFASDNLCAPFGRLISSGVEHRGEGKACGRGSPLRAGTRDTACALGKAPFINPNYCCYRTTNGTSRDRHRYDQHF